MLKLSFLLFILSVSSITAGYFYFSKDLPKLNKITDYQPPSVTRLFNNDGDLLAEYADQHRIITPLDEIPKQLIQAFLAAEDVHFYQHPGINPVRIASAAVANILAGHTVQGGSTITQQVAKNLLLSSERTYSRKIKEIILSYRMEQTLNKDEILFLYLNHIYLGRGSYGVASAAWRYFHKPLAELSLSECAILAGLPKAPSKYAPHIHAKKAAKRRNIVLGMMARNHFISARQLQQARTEVIHTSPQYPPLLQGAYAHTVYTQLIQQYGLRALRRQGLSIIVPFRPKAEQAAIRAVRKGILNIEQRQYYRPPEHLKAAQFSTWLNKHKTQTKADESHLIAALVTAIGRRGELLLNDGQQQWRLPKPRWQWLPIDKRKEGSSQATTWRVGDIVYLQGTRKGGVRLSQQAIVQAALYAIDLETGTALAEVGGFDYHFGGFNRVQQANRQPGSAFKPFLFATAMEQGYTAASIIVDSPLVFENTQAGDFWRPDNYRNRFAGPVTLRNALEHSRNLVAIKLLQELGMPRFLRSLKHYPFKKDRHFPKQLSLALGATEVSLKELTESYAVLASQGQRWSPVWVQQSQNRAGKTIHRAVAGHRCMQCHSSAPLSASSSMRIAEQIIDPIATFLTVNMMHGVIQHGTGRRALALHRPAAGKTGTTNKQVDAWFMGFTPQVLTGVWAGKDIPTSMGRRETGAHAALPIWLESMQAFHRGRKVQDFIPPQGIEWVAIDTDTGKRASADSKHTLLEAFRSGTAPIDSPATTEKPQKHDIDIDF